MKVLYAIVGFSLRLCLVPKKYQGKKKNAKENGFLMFGFIIIFLKKKLNIIKIS